MGNKASSQNSERSASKRSKTDKLHLSLPLSSHRKTSNFTDLDLKTPSSVATLDDVDSISTTTNTIYHDAKSKLADNDSDLLDEIHLELVHNFLTFHYLSF